MYIFNTFIYVLRQSLNYLLPHSESICMILSAYFYLFSYSYIRDR